MLDCLWLVSSRVWVDVCIASVLVVDFPVQFSIDINFTLTATFSTMVGGVISDIYHAKDRNTPMALFSGSALFGTGLAPMISGAIITHTTWRWVFYSHAIVSAVFVIIIYFFFKETRGSVLLSRKAAKLNQYYEQLEEAGHHGVILQSEEASEEKCIRRIRWKVKSDEQRASIATMIQISLYRPFRKSTSTLIHPQKKQKEKKRTPLTSNPRHAPHRTSSLLLLPMGLLQLGRPLPPIQLRPTNLPHKSQLHNRANRRRLHLHVRRRHHHHNHQYLPRTHRHALR